MLPNEILDSIKRALEEDIGTGDATTLSIVPPEATMRGQIIAKQDGIVAGLDVARATYELLDSSVDFSAQLADGSRVARTGVLALVSGRTSSLLTAERTALNFLGRMSGIATLTRQFVDAVAGTRAVILDTRKTAPGLRLVDKLAVKLGGGGNHRIGLYDMILIKDNHIDYAGGIEEAVRRARAFDSGLAIEVETRTLEDVNVALKLGVERILLDNMSVEMMAEAVRLRNDVVGTRHVVSLLEASGNVTLETVHRIAETGVDFISVGALTHSAKVFDVSFDYLK
ncbi:MAG: carboxylating nicotinate-nucleotide diphosphorylase [Anaerolineaceae bacterium]|nr:MAG: carboxylating nicotinate-nucleotide diphosphorylase [Anaerolineaceae bacterium]